MSPDLLRRQVTLVGSWTFSKHGQAECAEFVADQRVNVELPDRGSMEAYVRYFARLQSAENLLRARPALESSASATRNLQSTETSKEMNVNDSQKASRKTMGMLLKPSHLGQDAGHCHAVVMAP